MVNMNAINSSADPNSEKAPSMPNICFPVFTRIEIENYELFPGRSDTGLRHPFVPGVTVIAGVNGIGKTTLLNVMLRILVGPFNPEKVTPFEVGAKSHKLVRWKHRSYFRSRVSDEAANAKAYAEIVIGTHELKIRRKLSDLSIEYLEYDGQEVDPTEAEFERIALEASNTSTLYDFDFLVRYLVFFLEQRVPLFWNERGQIETFRILLCDGQLADAFQSKQDEIQQKDSQYRNLRWPANKRQKELLKQQANLASASETGARIEALQGEFRALRTKDHDLVEAINDAAAERSELRTKLLLLKIEMEEARRRYEGLQQEHLAAMMPTVAESVRYTFSGLLSSNGCSVCGNRSNRGAERLKRLLSEGICPVCESPKEEQEQRPSSLSHQDGDLREAAGEIVRLQHAVSELERQEKTCTEKLRDFAIARSEGQTKWSHVTQELERLNGKVPHTPDSLKALEAQVFADKEQMQDMEAELQKLYLQYEELIERVNERVAAVFERVGELFSTYAKSFLAERCYLGLSTYKDNVGQERQFEYPCFKVYMTSATSPNRETARSSEDDVSESQREFIDLAFRMALISAVSPAGSRAMLVIETPEASLDAYFVDQAGALLRQFGGQSSEGAGNVVIVSSNLNRQNMISALLGFSETDEDKWPTSADVRARVIDMLRECRENAAVRDYRVLYENALSDATHGRLLESGHDA